MVKVLVMDVDGTLTDGNIYMGVTCEMMKAFNIKDGYGIHNMLPQNNVIPVIITGRKSAIVENRCKELGIDHVYQGVHDKTSQLQEVLQALGYTFADTAYIGDDLNDLDCMQAVKANGGVVGCPCDAVAKVKELSDYVSERPGGKGAVRDFIDTLIRNECYGRI